MFPTLKPPMVPKSESMHSRADIICLRRAQCGSNREELMQLAGRGSLRGEGEANLALRQIIVNEGKVICDGNIAAAVVEKALDLDNHLARGLDPLMHANDVALVLAPVPESQTHRYETRTASPSIVECLTAF